MVSVYVIECAGRVKIGLANDPQQRVRDLNTGSPDPATLYAHRVYANRLTAHEIESRMHRLLRAKRVKGEWFDVPAAEAWALLKNQRPLRVIDPKARHDSAKRFETEEPEDLTNILTASQTNP